MNPSTSLRASLILLLAVSLGSASEFNSAARGTTTAGFLKLGVGARAAAMGEAQTAAAEGSEALYWNPAALTSVTGCSASFMHADYLENTYFDYASFAHRLDGDKGVIGLGIQYFSAGAINGTDTTGTDTGKFTPNDLALTAGYAKTTDIGSFGGSVKYIKSRVATNADTAAVDVGFQSPNYGGKLQYGVTVTNLGGKMKFDQAQEALPTALKAGVAYRVNPNWLAAADLLFPNDNKPGYALGTEYRYKVKEATTLAGRLGYNSRTAGDVSGFTGVSFGLGFGFHKYALDYALVPFGDLGITHRVSVSAKF